MVWLSNDQNASSVLISVWRTFWSIFFSLSCLWFTRRLKGVETIIAVCRFAWWPRQIECPHRLDCFFRLMRIKASSPRCCSEGNCPMYIYERQSRKRSMPALWHLLEHGQGRASVQIFFSLFVTFSEWYAKGIRLSPIPTLPFGCIAGFLRVLIGWRNFPLSLGWFVDLWSRDYQGGKFFCW